MLEKLGGHVSRIRLRVEFIARDVSLWVIGVEHDRRFSADPRNVTL
jgi:hypothetical protein